MNIYRERLDLVLSDFPPVGIIWVFWAPTYNFVLCIFFTETLIPPRQVPGGGIQTLVKDF